jgi:Flp pilus assembly protein TadG
MSNPNHTRAWDDNRGTTVVEFGILAPVAIMLLVGTFYLGLSLFLVGSLHFAVEEAARCASVNTGVCTDSATTVAYAQSHYFGPSASPTFTYAAAACGNSMTATISYVMDVGMTKFTIPVSASACFP